MAFAYQVVMNGHGHTVTGSLENAFEHILLAIHPNGLPPLSEDSLMIAASGLELSRFHRIIYELASKRWESADIVMHDLDQKPGFDTEVARFDLFYGFDPSYHVTKFLLDAERTDTSLVELADDLETEIEDGVRNALRDETRPEKVFGRYLDLQERFGGPKVIEMKAPMSPEQMADVLAKLPKLVRAKFEEMAAKAFPEEAAGFSP